jgi:hypothetical protein
MKAKTILSEQIWQSSDGQRTMWEVTLKGDDGKDYRLKTYSKKIAEVGFEGEIRSYVNPRGERMVRQVPEAGGYQGGGGGKQNNQPIIQTQWALGQARQFVNARGGGVIQDDDAYIKEIEDWAFRLIISVEKVMDRVAQAKAAND